MIQVSQQGICFHINQIALNSIGKGVDQLNCYERFIRVTQSDNECEAKRLIYDQDWLHPLLLVYTEKERMEKIA